MKTDISTQSGLITTPFGMSLPSPLAEGSYVFLRGRVTKPGIHGISFNFGTGIDTGSPVLFHYNPRFNEGQVVRNTKTNAGWGKEEREGGIPFKVEQHFELRIVALAKSYQCHVNGVKHCEFAHRIDMAEAKYFFIVGDTEINNIVFGDKNSGDCICSLDVPFSMPVDVFPGRKIYLSGVPSPNASRITVDLNCAKESGGDDVALTFDCRFKNGNCVDTVVMNTMEAGKWGTEEKPKAFPFKVEQFFNIVIEVQSDKFKICVNDEPFAEYAHRMLPLNEITHLYVFHDVNLHCVHFH